jgi:hypothetical protein
MTEAERNSCTDPQVMLDWLREQGKLSERKAPAVCGRVLPNQLAAADGREEPAGRPAGGRRWEWTSWH